MHRLRPALPPLLLSAALLAACAAPSGTAPSTPRAAGAPVAPAAAAAAAAASAPAPGPTRPALAALPTPGMPPPFATVVKDARRIEGPLVLWQKDEKVWIELPPHQFGQPFLLSPKIKSGIGEAGVLGGLMALPVSGAGGAQVVEFVRVHNQVRLQSRNLDVLAREGTPEARAVATSYTHSLLGSAAVASAPHPQHQAVLIEANGIFQSDLMGVGMMLQRAFRQGYGLDGRHSGITAVRASPAGTVIETQSHFYTGSLGTGGIAPPGAPPGLPQPQLPRYLPDSRSMLVGMHYSLSPLPATPMATRRADPRLGLFSTTVLDFTSDTGSSPRQRHIHRWRLEKKEPNEALSPPVQPITFWIDRNVPLAYRDTVRSAILEWNKAFERIGFLDAIVVRQQPDDATFDTLDTGYASVRWMLSAEPGFSAIGPSHVDPRSGEILDADIAIEGATTRLRRLERAQVLGHQARADGAAATGASADPFAAPLLPEGLQQGLPAHALCAHGDLAAEQLAYALDLLAARDELDPAGPEAEQFVLDYIKDTVMHETGHALGLRHNFRASRIYTDAQLSDPAFTRANGTTGSVMEYNAINLARPGQPAVTPFQLTLGPYDHWAIEYAYKPIAAADEAAELQRIAARSSEPQLAFGTDEDSLFALDPETLQFDLGDDPLAFAAKRLDIARDLFRRQESRRLPPDRDYAVLRRSLTYALGDVTRALTVLARQIGGVRTLRDYPGSGRDPLQPVDPAVQRQALALMVDSVLGADGLTLTPALQRRLAPDFLERAEAGSPTDFALPQRLLDLQRAVLGHLMSDGVAARILDSAEKFDRPEQALQLAEVHAQLQRAVWAGLDGTAAIAPARRELQREHVNRLAAALLRPSGRADGRGLVREQAQALLARLDRAGRRAAPRDTATRSHLRDSADSLRQALGARVPRLAV